MRISYILIFFIFLTSCEKKLDTSTAESIIMHKYFQGKTEVNDKIFTMQYYDHTIYRDVYIESYKKLEEEGMITFENVPGFFGGYLSVQFTEKGKKYKASEPFADDFDISGTNKRVKVVASIKKFDGVIGIHKQQKNTYLVTYKSSVIATPFGKYLKTAPIFSEKPIVESQYNSNITIYYDKNMKYWKTL